MQRVVWASRWAAAGEPELSHQVASNRRVGSSQSPALNTRWRRGRGSVDSRASASTSTNATRNASKNAKKNGLEGQASRPLIRF